MKSKGVMAVPINSRRNSVTETDCVSNNSSRITMNLYSPDIARNGNVLSKSACKSLQGFSEFTPKKPT